MNPFRLSSRLQPPRARPLRVLGEPAGARAAPAAPPEARGPVSGSAAVSAPAATALEVPWRLSRRSTSGVVEVENLSDRPLYSARFALAGGGLLGLSLPRTVLPGERIRVVVRGPAPESACELALSAPDAMLVLRWFESDGRELLWPIAL
ncbi:hypothetical protein [Leucobacter luti]|uniref:hypothetical protein n=1 Tax=Leucobacter luti TaxID=340320 RepID=UPI003D0115DB